MAEKVRARLGERAVVSNQADLAPWLTDWRGRWTGQAAALLQPASTEEVAEIVRLAEASGVALVPQGGNTSMVGGATPGEDGSALLLSMRRMNGIRAIGPEQAAIEAGVILADLHDAAEAIGRRFPLTLGARGSATVGGLASTNAGGTQVLRFGTMRQLVTGVEAVLSGGLVHDGLAGLKKDNRGYALDQLLVGAEGTLGIITAVAVRLVPAVIARGVAWVGLADPQAGLDLLRRLQQQTDRVEGFEILPQDSLDRVLRYIPGTRPPLAGQHAWHALIEATATSAGEEPPSELLQRLLEPALADGLVEDAAIAASEAQAEAFWRIRHSISEAEKKSGPAMQHDISVPVATMPRFMVEAAREVEARFPGTDASGFGHLGDGNIHFHVRAPAEAGADWIAGEGPAASRFVHDLVTAAGGSISAEHGIGQMKRGELERLGSPARLAAMRAIKAAMDPHGIFNPGKLIA
ncbi:FAD-binding oxidoreductase [Sphingomonas sp. BN140010]|uniref:FAD-binding oxidoreductase n=2 Tax=Sphingomonas arvum TaxID=2992113 RepID=A0ABT3JH71_9SPHN|nr:FAD-binding oxidoreductase [Sphingomonas sp. BN140010]MCW3798427.1 FAD-binding oxidoreductase [Sphingomonas sp. BN140010]